MTRKRLAATVVLSWLAAIAAISGLSAFLTGTAFYDRVLSPTPDGTVDVHRTAPGVPGSLGAPGVIMRIEPKPGVDLREVREYPEPDMATLRLLRTEYTCMGLIEDRDCA